ncbi:Retinoic acid induced 16-like protein-domain-containing protein [Kickxella alabastrina]|uniref:Retinoic acid induced 16-like protein-domain-containing protein n=1 Tax=Kickxella alabastrina TaxID=61397 RepID=UPI0022205AA9|nr:Retinoic acid induced 16-like protein-domain-containing protein [Kickxella alabastrina]KAI7833964.1 Retinoic acid induced 16-like protein-domain-containing protein [Kickxella alabastrina]
MRTLVDNVSVAFDGPAPTAKDRLVENWTRIQEYYTRQADLRRLQIGDTTIPHHLECMLKILAYEMLENEQGAAAAALDQDGTYGADRLAQPLEFGACVEFLLQFHVLSDLVDLADADLPRGMRKYVLRFFDIFIDGIPLGLLPESAIRLPLVAIMRQCLHVVQTSPTTPINSMRRQEPMAEALQDAMRQSQGSSSAASAKAFRLGQGYHSIQNDRAAVVLCHDLLQLIVTLFKRLREHSSMVYLFFDWDSGEWRQAGGQAQMQAQAQQGQSHAQIQPQRGDLAVSTLRSATSGYMEQSARGHELFIVHIIVEYLLAPGLTGQLAREALVLVVQVLLAPQDKAPYVSFLLDQARIVELLVEHMGYLHSQMPVFRPMPRSPKATLFGPAYSGARCQPPLQRRMHQAQQPPQQRFDIRPRLHRLLGEGSVLRSVAQQDQREAAILVSARLILEHVDAFFLCWELLDEVAMVACTDERLTAAVQSQLMNGFLRTHIEPALLMANMSAAKSQAITTVSYLHDIVNVTHSNCVLEALLMVLLGSDLGPEQPPWLVSAAEQNQGQGQGSEQNQSQGQSQNQLDDAWAELSLEDRELLQSIEDDAMRAEAAALLLPPGFDLSRLQMAPPQQQQGSGAQRAEHSTGAPVGLRATLIAWMTLEDDTHLPLNTLRLFDTILATMSQFAYTSLVLRNFIDRPVVSAAAAATDAGGAARLEEPGFVSGPALGRGASVAADQELVRAVVERFLDATPSSISAALPEIVVGAALRLDGGPEAAAPSHLHSQHQLEAPRNFQNMRSTIMMRESQGCDDYVADCLQRLRLAHQCTRLTWVSKDTFVRAHTPAQQQQPLQPHHQPLQPQPGVSAEKAADDALAGFYPGAFLASLIGQLESVVRRHMAYNLTVTSMFNRLTCLADPALSAFLFLANSATVPASPASSSSASAISMLYDTYVGASAEAYVKSEHVPRFPARLARQHREGVETAVRVAADHSAAAVKPEDTQVSSASAAVIKPRVSATLPDTRVSETRSYAKAAAIVQPPPSLAPLHGAVVVQDASMDVDSPEAPRGKNKEEVRRAVGFLGTPIKRFVHGYIVLDEFGKEMAAMALALHTLELERSMDKVALSATAGAAAVAAGGRMGEVDDYADWLEYFDPEEPAYLQALAIKESLKQGIIELGGNDNNPAARADIDSSGAAIASASAAAAGKGRRRRKSSASSAATNTGGNAEVVGSNSTDAVAAAGLALLKSKKSSSRRRSSQSARNGNA